MIQFFNIPFIVLLTLTPITYANQTIFYSDLEYRISQLNTNVKEKTEINVLSLMVNEIVNKYLSNCHINIMYDDVFDTDYYYRGVLQKVFSSLKKVSYEIYNINKFSSKFSSISEPGCKNYIIFCQDPEITGAKFGHVIDSRVLIVTIASSWQIREFFTGKVAQNILHLLVASAGPALHDKNQGNVNDIKLYTHELYIDGLGSSTQQILTTWRQNRFTRPEINLFPVKLANGFQGHQFILSVIEKPPLIFRSSYVKDDGYHEQSLLWDGVEIRLLKIISELLNFTLEVHDATMSKTGDELEDRVISDLVASKADLGISGLYMSADRYSVVDFSPVIMQDCGTFMSLGSYALSKYRAIFGPFHWSIWVMVIFTYMIAILPISFTNNRNIKKLCKSPKQLESMCCYMFGTFTNLFTFKGVKSWTNGKMGSTRLFIGTYWIFTIIITTAYTSSIIAFITLPEQPITVDNSYELIDEGYRIITLNKGGWQYYLNITDDILSKKMISNIKLMNTSEEAIDYIVKTRFILDYAFLGSKISLTYLSQNNFLQKYKNKKIFLHVASECYVPFNIGVAYKKKFVYRSIFSNSLLRVLQSGLLTKILKDIEWEITQRSGVKKSILITPEDRQLTLDDVQGMFILLGGGVFVAALILLVEFIARKIELRQTVKDRIKQRLKRTKRSKSSTLKENVIIIQSRPLTAF